MNPQRTACPKISSVSTVNTRQMPAAAHRRGRTDSDATEDGTGALEFMSRAILAGCLPCLLPTVHGHPRSAWRNRAILRRKKARNLSAARLDFNRATDVDQANHSVWKNCPRGLSMRL